MTYLSNSLPLFVLLSSSLLFFVLFSSRPRSYEPLEVTLQLFRLDRPAADVLGALGKLLDLDIGELIEHPQVVSNQQTK